MEAQLNQAFQLVSQPHTETIKRGQQLLNSLKTNPQYPLALLHYMNGSTHDAWKLRAAIELKLWCQTFRSLDQFERQCYGQYIDDIRQAMLMAYLQFPLKISKTLRPGLVALADVLFPQNWRDLIQNLLAYAIQNNGAILAVLKLIQSISHKYSYEQRSDPLYEEIIIVCDEIHDFLIELMKNTVSKVMGGNASEFEVNILEILIKVFYNLNYQDLHPKFEDNLVDWMNYLKMTMSLNSSGSNSEHIFKCKGAALEVILLYSNKYKEDVKGIIQEFCQEIWQLCSNASEDSEFDDIVFNCLKFFKSLMLWPDMKSFFQQHLLDLFQNLILPNMGATQAQNNIFEEEVDLYIDYYFRNIELQTRRAAALELLRVICRHYQSFFQPFLQSQIQSFESIAGNIKAEINLIELIIDGSSKAFRDVDGCTQLFVNQQYITHTYEQNIKKRLFAISDWISKNQGSNIETCFQKLYIATIVRFLFFFRVYLPRQELTSVVKFIASIQTNSHSLKKVLQLAINGFLVMKHGDFTYYRNLEPFFRGQPIREIAVPVLKVAYEGTVAQQALQEFLTKMMFNLTKGLASHNTQFFEYEIEIIRQMLKKTAVYDFTTVQFLFESIGNIAFYLIKEGSPHRKILEKQMMDFFIQALQTKSDLLNFCLQILAIFLQLEQSTDGQYVNIYSSLLMPENWSQENQSLMSAYIQFLIAFIAKHKNKLIQDKGRVELVLSKVIEIDHVELFYRFMETIMINITLQEFAESGYLNLVMQGGQVISKSTQGRKATLIFFSKLILFYDTLSCLEIINRFEPNFYEQMLEANLDIVRTITQRTERRYIFGAICKAANLKYFPLNPFLGTLIDSLITNTAEKFNIRNMSFNLKERQVSDKKESTYKKLQIFNEFERHQEELNIIEEKEILETFKNVNNMYPDVINMIDMKNRDRLKKINDNYSKQ